MRISDWSSDVCSSDLEGRGMTLAWIVLLPFIGALLPGLLIRAGRDACALATGAVTLLALILLLTQAPAVFAREVVEARWDWPQFIGLTAPFFGDGPGLLFACPFLAPGLSAPLHPPP